MLQWKIHVITLKNFHVFRYPLIQIMFSVIPWYKLMPSTAVRNSGTGVVVAICFANGRVSVTRIRNSVNQTKRLVIVSTAGWIGKIYYQTALSRFVQLDFKYRVLSKRFDSTSNKLLHIIFLVFWTALLCYVTCLAISCSKSVILFTECSDFNSILFSLCARMKDV